mmetsp:Transcript_63637/g.180731  ORF Transcript_63637/g.180731 Transcript_63637/m.180731 type:complete len:90 (-) Transcript_63637:76-345(-)
MLREDEFIVCVEQSCREEYLGNTLAFYTSAGAVYKLSGMEASSSRRFAAPPGRQVCGLDFEASRLRCVRTCPAHASRPQASEVQVHDVT